MTRELWVSLPKSLSTQSAPSYLVMAPLYPRVPRPETGRFPSAPRTALQKSWLPPLSISASPRLRRDRCAIPQKGRDSESRRGTVTSDPGTQANQYLGSPDHAPGHPHLSWANPTAPLSASVPTLTAHRSFPTQQPEDTESRITPRSPWPPSTAPTRHPRLVGSWCLSPCHGHAAFLSTPAVCHQVLPLFTDASPH